MNKLYLLAAIAAAAYGQTYSEEEVEACDITFTEEESGDWAYSWIIELDVSTSEEFYNDGADPAVTVDGNMCYNDFIYNFSVDSGSCDADGEDCVLADDTAVDGEDNTYLFGYAADGEDEDDVSFEEMETIVGDVYGDIEDLIADILAGDDVEQADPYDGGIMEFGSEIYTSSESTDDVETAAAGIRLVFVAVTGGDVADGVITYEGMSNNAVFQAASAFTVAAVAGLFF